MNINSVNNSVYVNKVQTIKTKLNNMIAFKGQLQQDVFEPTSKMSKDVQSQMLEDINRLRELDSKIAQIQEEVVTLMNEYSTADLEYKDAKASPLSSFDSEYIKEKETAFNTALHNLQEKIKQKYELVDSKEELQEAVDSWKQYRKRKAQNDRLADLYNPRLTKQERVDLAKKIGGVIEPKDLKENGIVTDAVISSWVDAQALEVRKIGGKDGRVDLIDLNLPVNQELKKAIDTRVYDCMLGNEVAKLYEYSAVEMAQALKDGSFEILGYNNGTIPKGPASSLIDMKSPITQKNLHQRRSFVPLQSKDYFVSDYSSDVLIPAPYLSNLGFGTIEEIQNLVKIGKLYGARRRTQDGVVPYVFVSAQNGAKDTLLKLREQNPNIIDAKSLSKKIGVQYSDLKRAMKFGLLEIIPEYIFEQDSKQIYIDMNNQQNKEYLSRFNLG